MVGRTGARGNLSNTGVRRICFPYLAIEKVLHISVRHEPATPPHKVGLQLDSLHMPAPVTPANIIEHRPHIHEQATCPLIVGARLLCAVHEERDYANPGPRVTVASLAVV